MPSCYVCTFITYVWTYLSHGSPVKMTEMNIIHPYRHALTSSITGSNPAHARSDEPANKDVNNEYTYSE